MYVYIHMMHIQGISDLSANTKELTSDILFVYSLFPHLKEDWIQPASIWFHVLFFPVHTFMFQIWSVPLERKKKSEFGHLNYVAEIQPLLSGKTDINICIIITDLIEPLFFSPRRRPNWRGNGFSYIWFDLVKWPLPAPCDRCRNLNRLWTPHCWNRPRDFITGRHYNSV